MIKACAMSDRSGAQFTAVAARRDFSEIEKLTKIRESPASGYKMRNLA